MSKILSEKICKKCFIKKPTSDFYQYRWECKSCMIDRTTKLNWEKPDARKIYLAKYYAKNTVKLREYSLGWKRKNWDRVLISARKTSRSRKLKALGISISDFHSTIEAQGGRCAVCQSVEVSFDGGRHVHIDHCHKTGKFRGVLCGHCNAGLGQFKDDPARLMRAAEYLKRGQIVKV